MEISKILVLSTGHITEEDSHYLTREGFGASYEYGYFLPISRYLRREVKERRSLASLVDYCFNKDISYLRLDNAGPVESEFELFDW